MGEPTIFKDSAITNCGGTPLSTVSSMARFRRPDVAAPYQTTSLAGGL
jgi:hypothetical protein